MTARERFAKNLRDQRKARGMSQEELGDLADLHRTEVSLLERGKRDPRLGTIVQLAKGLKISPEQLLSGIK